jgi:hypothetical protein
MVAKTALWRVSGYQLEPLKPAGPAFQCGDEYLATTEAWTSVHDDSSADVDGFGHRAGIDCGQRDDLPDN